MTTLINRRLALMTFAGLATALNPGPSFAAGVGAVLIHGKQDGPGSGLGSVQSALEARGVQTVAPTMPWAGGRYLSESWSVAIAEIGAAVQEVRRRGATKVVLVGHSMGCPASASYANSNGGIAGIVMAAYGHNPRFSYDQDMTRESVLRAREMVRSGRGGETATFADNNQGRMNTVTLTAAGYLSYLEPDGPASWTSLAQRVRVPVMFVAGTSDEGAMFHMQRFGRRLASRAPGRVLVVAANHVATPNIARDQIAEWITSI